MLPADGGKGCGRTDLGFLARDTSDALAYKAIMASKDRFGMSLIYFLTQSLNATRVPSAGQDTKHVHHKLPNQ